MKLVIVLNFFVFIFLTFSQRPAIEQDKNAIYYTKFRDIKCESFDNSTGVMTFCFIKALSRTKSTLNFGYELFKPLNSFYIQVVASYRYGNIYREIVDTKVVDFCSAMSGSDYNLFLKLIIDMVSASIPNLFHKCPYEGRANYYNITLDIEISKKWSIFPDGQYK